METEKHYFKVGLFFLTILGIFVYYLMTFGGENENQTLTRYAVYFDHSVAGLTRGAPVKLQGIAVGLVDSIRFVSRDSNRILVLADISETAPVHADTVASVSFQGITGTTYLSLENANPAAPAVFLSVPPGEKYPVIPSKQSEILSILNDAPATMEKLTGTVEQAQRLLSAKNVTAMQGLIPETHDALTEAAGAFREIKMLARTLREDPSIIIRGTKYDGYQVHQ
jgi:phospholipid/cholesterol/gamma-HCH transport system substrate-binding protein